MNIEGNNINKPNIYDFIYKIRKHPDFGQTFVHLRHIPAVEASYGDALDLPDELVDILHRNKIEILYSHQTEAIDKIRKRENIIISTPTASGKSLIYNLSILERLVAGENCKALYIFPLTRIESPRK